MRGVHYPLLIRIHQNNNRDEIDNNDILINDITLLLNYIRKQILKCLSSICQ